MTRYGTAYCPVCHRQVRFIGTQLARMMARGGCKYHTDAECAEKGSHEPAVWRRPSMVPRG